jgi:hypothetical protein
MNQILLRFKNLKFFIIILFLMELKIKNKIF